MLWINLHANQYVFIPASACLFFADPFASNLSSADAAYPSDGCDCFGPDTVWDGGTWVTCDDEANHVFINTHDNDPDNTCADNSIWNCPAELNSRGQGYEPFGCYSLAYGYSMGGGNSVTQGVADIDTCGARCSATSVKMAYSSTSQQCECVRLFPNLCSLS